MSYVVMYFKVRGNHNYQIGEFKEGERLGSIIETITFREGLNGEGCDGEPYCGKKDECKGVCDYYSYRLGWDGDSNKNRHHIENATHTETVDDARDLAMSHWKESRK